MMDKQDEEVEIKIEYLESLETDPLSYSHEKNRNDNSRLDFGKLYINISDDNSPCSMNDEISVTYGNKYIANHESDAKWYKQINLQGKYVCKYCDIAYSTVQTLRGHVKIKHTNEFHMTKNSTLDRIRQQCIKCHICTITFRNISDLKAHSQMHSLTNIKSYCFNKYRDSKKKLHICSLCGYSTQRLSHFKEHVVIHTNKNQEKCGQCDYTTNRLSNLRRHEKIHSIIDKPFVCTYEGCSYRCMFKSALKSHQLIHNKKEHMLYCDKCNYGTVHKHSLDKHIDSHRRNRARPNL